MNGAVGSNAIAIESKSNDKDQDHSSMEWNQNEDNDIFTGWKEKENDEDEDDNKDKESGRLDGIDIFKRKRNKDPYQKQLSIDVYEENVPPPPLRHSATSACTNG